MTTTESSASEVLAERLLDACVHALDLLHVHVGSELRLYRVLAESGPSTTSSALLPAGRLSTRFQQLRTRPGSHDDKGEIRDGCR